MASAEDDRRFDEREFSIILRKAAELQERDAARPAHAGLTLREIEAIAEEAGIDAKNVRSAALMLGHARPGMGRRLLGPSSHIHAQATATTQFGKEALAAMIDAAQAETGRTGSAREVLGGIEWSSRDSMGTIQVTARLAGGETRVQVSTDRKEAAASIATLAPITGMIGGGTLGAVVGLPPLAAAGIAVAGGLIAARMLWSRVVAKWDGRVHRLLERVVSAAQAAEATSPGRKDPGIPS